MKKGNNVKENLEKIKEELQDKKRLPKLEKKQIIKKCKINFALLIIILIYLFSIQTAEENIQTEEYITALKILSITLIAITIIMFEISYKYNKNEIIIHSIEILILSFYTLFLIPAYSLYYGNFYKVTVLGACTSTIYYTIKSIIIIIELKKKHNKSLTDIKSIIAK